MIYFMGMPQRLTPLMSYYGWLPKYFIHREIRTNEFAQLLFGASKRREFFFRQSDNAGFLTHQFPKKPDLGRYKIPGIAHSVDPVCTQRVIIQSISQFRIEDLQCRVQVLER